MTTITLQALKADHAALGERIAQFEAQASTSIVLPGIALVLPHGEHHAGLVLDEEGRPSHHLILLPGQVQRGWNESLEWAKSIGGDLPTRPEQALLYANLKGKFEAAWYWSNTQYSEYYAWGQDFGYGGQGNTGKRFQARARAVRRLSV